MAPAPAPAPALLIKTPIDPLSVNDMFWGQCRGLTVLPVLLLLLGLLLLLLAASAFNRYRSRSAFIDSERSVHQMGCKRRCCISHFPGLHGIVGSAWQAYLPLQCIVYPQEGPESAYAADDDSYIADCKRLNSRFSMSVCFGMVTVPPMVHQWVLLNPLGQTPELGAPHLHSSSGYELWGHLGMLRTEPSRQNSDQSAGTARVQS